MQRDPKPVADRQIGTTQRRWAIWMCGAIRFHSFQRHLCRIGRIKHNHELWVRCEDRTIRRTVDLCIGKRLTLSGVDLISDVLPFGGLWYGESNAAENAIGYAMHSSRSQDAVIRVYDEGGNMNHSVGVYLATAVVKATGPAFPACATRVR